ncbi:MAG TPA: hypothetical protein VK445_02140, partial [Dissulfurispiraceae bacterium]|nr:hypothetical protein [Dissulfurispiraceae bacterium]
MKKYTSILLSLVLVLGFAASAFAIHAEIPLDTQSVVAKGSTQITIDGDLRFRGRILGNTQDFNKDTQSIGDNSMYDSRVRLGVTAQVTPNTLGRILLEAGASDSDTIVWGNTPAGISSTNSIATITGSKGSAQFGEYKIP